MTEPSDERGPKGASAFLDTLSDQIKEDFEQNRRLLSFSQFLELCEAHPRRFARNAAQYMRDCFDHFGVEERTSPGGAFKHYKLFDCPFDDGRDRLIGQQQAQQAIYRVLTSFVQDGRIQRLVLFHGPNGSAKSSLIRCIMRALEAYSHTDEGALYRFNWVFPADKIARDSIGFGGASSDRPRPSNGETYAFLDDLDIDAKLTDELRDNPLFLLPVDFRRQLLDQALSGDHQEGDDRFVLSEYVVRGDLSHKSKQIYEALLASYQGDYKSVMRHVQVERFYISRRYRQGAVTIEPQLRVDAGLRQITADRSLQALPASLQNQTLFELVGALIEGNRGVIEYNDLLKRPQDFNRYLLSTSEKGTVALDNAIVHLDTLLVGSANETYLSAFKASPEYPSFNARLELIRMPYLCNHTVEQQIYEEQITSSELGKPIAPHSTYVAALWAVLTRLRRPRADRYPEAIGEAIAGLTPLEKADLYADGTVPERFNAEQTRAMRAHIRDMLDDGSDGEGYEGRIGASPREMKALLLRASQNPDYPHLSPLAIFGELRQLVREISVYKFLQIEADGAYRNPADFIDTVTERYLDLIDADVRSAMGLVDEERYVDFFERYVEHVTHWIKREKLYNKTTGRFEEPDEGLMQEVEGKIGGVGDADAFRNDLMTSIAAWSIDNQGQSVHYPTIFPRYMDAIRRSYFEARKEQVRRIKQNILAYLGEEGTSMNPAEIAQVELTLKNLQDKFGYTLKAAQEAVVFLFKRRYGS